MVLLGDFSNERLDLSFVGPDFGWTVAQASELSGLREIGRSRTVLAVIIQAGALGVPWPDAMRAVRAAVPRARLILCYKIDQAHARTKMIDAGAFGVVLSPLANSEVRQALGFVWASRIKPVPHVPSGAGKVRPIRGHLERVNVA